MCASRLTVPNAFVDSHYRLTGRAVGAVSLQRQSRPSLILVIRFPPGAALFCKKNSMKRIIAPVDFSEPAENAAVFAGNLAAFYGAELWLYHAYSLPIAADYPMVTPGEMQEAADDEMETFKQKVLAAMRVSITVHVVAESAGLIEGLGALADTVKPDLIVMGLTGRNRLARLVVGSNTIRAVQQLPYTVLAVPSKASFTPVRKIGFACDFNKEAAQAPIDTLKKLLQDFNADLYVLNVVPPDESLPQEKVEGSLLVGEALKAYEANFQMVLSGDITEGINWFAQNNQLDWVAVIPKKHKALEKIFGRSHTKHLLYHTHIPVLCMHE
jgi:nucleotide-binding universal stress UspA family protein